MLHAPREGAGEAVTPPTSRRYQEEVAKLYKEAKINPMSGCLWTLIPFPIVIILYSVVRQPLVALMKLTQENITTLTDVVTRLGYYTAPAKTDVYSQMTIANVLHEHFADIVSNPGVAEFADQAQEHQLPLPRSQHDREAVAHVLEHSGMAERPLGTSRCCVPHPVHLRRHLPFSRRCSPRR